MDKIIGYRIMKKSGKYHLSILRVETTYMFLGRWGKGKREYSVPHSAHHNEPDAVRMMNTLIDAETTIVTSDDYDIKGARTNISY